MNIHVQTLKRKEEKKCREGVMLEIIRTRVEIYN